MLELLGNTGLGSTLLIAAVTAYLLAPLFRKAKQK